MNGIWIYHHSPELMNTVNIMMKIVINKLNRRYKMGYKILSEEVFNGTPELTVNCRSEKTSYGFRHLASRKRNYQLS
jgi:hypothetical protein